jgi:hypothetical protein
MAEEDDNKNGGNGRGGDSASNIFEPASGFISEKEGEILKQPFLR